MVGQQTKIGVPMLTSWQVDTSVKSVGDTTSIENSSSFQTATSGLCKDHYEQYLFCAETPMTGTLFTVLVLVTLGDVTQLEPILYVPHCSRKPWEASGAFAKKNSNQAKLAAIICQQGTPAVPDMF
jgi:hypothetical protein